MLIPETEISIFGLSRLVADTNLVLLGTGAGPDVDTQYLFAKDVLDCTTGVMRGEWCERDADVRTVIAPDVATIFNCRHSL